jgi:hypothetical protein
VSKWRQNARYRYFLFIKPQEKPHRFYCPMNEK